jgi:predicted transcriptional regulator
VSSHKPLLGFVLAFLVAFSLIALIQSEKTGVFRVNVSAPFSFHVPSTDDFGYLVSPACFSQPVFGDVVKEAPSSLNNSTRAAIYDFVVANPGVQFRGICAGLSIAVGTAEFHLGVLKRAGLISFVRDGKYKRFFATKTFNLTEMKLISLLRHDTVKEILSRIAGESHVTHGRLASELSITSQGLTWQMNRLKEEGVVQAKFEGLKVSYSINQVYLDVLPEVLLALGR